MHVRTSRSKISDAQIQEILSRIYPIFAEVSGVEEMDMYSDLEDDLSVNMTTDFQTIIKKINAEFSINLNAKAIMHEVSIVAELVDLIIEEITLG